MAYFKKTFFLFVILPMAFIAKGQNGWEPWEELYHDADITVKVSYSLSNSACNQQWGVLNKYRYKLTGQLKQYNQFVNWKMAYMGCDGRVYYLQHSINIGSGGVTNTLVEKLDWQFEGTTIVNPHFEVTASYSNEENNTPRLPTPGMPISTLEAKVLSDKTVCRGSYVTLTCQVKNGSGNINYSWQQSTDNSTWSSVTYVSDESYTTPQLYRTMYYRCIITDNNAALRFPVTSNQVIVTISDPVVNVTGDNSVCKGVKAFLNAAVSNDDKAGTFQWQTVSSSNNYNDIPGATYSTFNTPEINNTLSYRVVYTPSNRNCAVASSSPHKISVIQTPSITVTDDRVVCSGSTATLYASLNSIASNGTYQWQSSPDKLVWSEVGNSNSAILQTSGLYSTTYFRSTYVLNSAGCIKSNSNAVRVDVIQSAQVTVSGRIKVKEGRRASFTANSNKTEGSYQWQRSNNGYSWQNIPGATGTKLKTEKLTGNAYFRCSYRLSGANCEAYSQDMKVSVIQPLWHNSFATTEKFMHVALGLGVEMGPRPLPGIQTTTQSNGVIYNYTSNINVVNPFMLGVRGDFAFHPYIKDFFAIGFKLGGGVGTVPLAIIGSQKTDNGTTTRESYLTYKGDVGAELTAGYKAFKILFAYQSSLQEHQYTLTKTNSTTITQDVANVHVRRETMQAGFRIGRYDANRSYGKRYKHPFCIDLYYAFGWDRRFNWAPFEWSSTSYFPLSQGAGIALWIQSILTLRAEVFPSAAKGYGTGSNGKSFTQVSIIYNADWFRGKQ